MGNAKKEDTAKDRKTTNSIRNEQQKAKSRVAAKNRRKNENENIEQLTRLVPWIPDSPPDKSTIIRLSTSYIGLMRVLNGSRDGHMIGDGCTANKGIENFCMEALDGFIIILSKTGTITFVNEKVVSYLGFPPHELMGKKIYNFVLRKDWEKLARKLRGPLPSLDNPNVREPQDDPDDVVCEPDAAELFVPYFENAKWNDKVQFSVRMQCNLIRRGNSSKTTSFQVVRFTGVINADGYFMGTGEHAWSPDLGDLPVFEPAFISRLTPDLKLLYCEGRIHRYMDTEAKDIVGRVVYPFYHPTDTFHIQKMHSKLLAEGKVTTVPYRWMNKDGGWVWLKSTTTRIQDEKTGREYMLCVNYVLSAIENKGVVVGMNPETSEKVVERDIEKENENDSNDAYLVDELTEAFTECNPFALPAYTAGQTQDGQGKVPNVFGKFPETKTHYPNSLTAQEKRAKPYQEFYLQHSNENGMRQQANGHFNEHSWTQGQHTWPALEKKWQQNDFKGFTSQNNHDQFSLEDLMSGQFSPEFVACGTNSPIHQDSPYSEDIYSLHMAELAGSPQLKDLEQQYETCCGLGEESFRQENDEFVPPAHIKVEPEDANMSDFDMPNLYFPEEDFNQEGKAYEASLFLFMNEIPLDQNPISELPISELSKPLPANYANHHSNGFTPERLINEQGCYPNFSQLNQNNNILPASLVNPGLLNELAEETCILDFDPSLLN